MCTCVFCAYYACLCVDFWHAFPTPNLRYGLHCPDVATLPCINVHPVSSPFSDVLRLSKLLEGSNADRYSADPRSSLLHILEDFKNGRVRRESFNVMDNIKTFGTLSVAAAFAVATCLRRCRKSCGVGGCFCLLHGCSSLWLMVLGC